MTRLPDPIEQAIENRNFEEMARLLRYEAKNHRQYSAVYMRLLHMARWNEIDKHRRENYHISDLEAVFITDHSWPDGKPERHNFFSVFLTLWYHLDGDLERQQIAERKPRSERLETIYSVKICPDWSCRNTELVYVTEKDGWRQFSSAGNTMVKQCPKCGLRFEFPQIWNLD